MLGVVFFSIYKYINLRSYVKADRLQNGSKKHGFVMMMGQVEEHAVFSLLFPKIHEGLYEEWNILKYY